jgi:REP element-mobilizing transposase RayT
MPNHFHWLIRLNDNYEDIITSQDNSPAKTAKPLNSGIATLLSSYTRGMNHSIGRTGSLFRGKTKAKLITVDDIFDDDYVLTCFLYIHQNPVRAGLVNRLEDWEFSSYRDYIGIRKGTLCNTKSGKELLELPENTDEFIRFSNQTIPDLGFLD